MKNKPCSFCKNVTTDEYLPKGWVYWNSSNAVSCKKSKCFEEARSNEIQTINYKIKHKTNNPLPKGRIHMKPEKMADVISKSSAKYRNGEIPLAEHLNEVREIGLMFTLLTVDKPI
jgi:hypothetical protein